MGIYYLCLITFMLSYLCEIEGDQCDTCRRRPHTCETVKGEFSKKILSQGYNFIQRIPSGACSINITELAPSSNYVALKTRSGVDIVNSQWTITSPGTYSKAGTTIKYGRSRDSICPGECVLILGPTNETIDFQILAYHTNPGLLYEYKLPQRKRRNGRHHRHNEKRRSKKQHRKKSQSKYAWLSEVQGANLQTTQSSSRTKDSNILGKSDGNIPQNGRASSNLHYNKKLDILAQLKPTQTPVTQTFLGPKARTPSPPVASLWPHDYNAFRNPGQHHQSRKHRKHGYQALSLGETVYASRSRIIKPSNSHGAARGPSYLGRRILQRERTVLPYRENLHLGPKHPDKVDAVRHQPEESWSRPWESPTVLRPPKVHQIPGEHPKLRLKEGPTYVSPYEAEQTFRNVQSLSSGPLKDPKPLPLPQPGVHGSINPQGIPLQVDNIPSQQRGGQNQPFLPSKNSFIIQRQLPDVDESHGRTIAYSWRYSGFTNCSLPCGIGTQETVIICIKGASEAIVTEDNCDARLKPQPQNVQCNTQPCQPEWETGNWSSCSVTCGSGLQRRRVECKKRISASLQLSVSANRCPISTKPSIVQQCQSEACARWKVQPWQPCSASCGKGERIRSVSCVDKDNRPMAESHCKDIRPVAKESCHRGHCTKQWFYTDWTDKCSSECGVGRTSRQVYCLSKDGKVVKNKRCDQRYKPEAETSCETNRLCGGQWFTGPWKVCSVTCGKGTSTREIICMKNTGGGSSVPVSENNCNEDKPEREKLCEGLDCGTHWFMTQWSKCSVSCGTGQQTREVRCLDGGGEISSGCHLDHKPERTQTCTKTECNTSTKPPDSSCKDELTNCYVVAQARLCRYSLYKSVCCDTCTNH